MKNNDALLKTSHLSVDFPMKKAMPWQKGQILQAVTDVSIEIYKGETHPLEFKSQRMGRYSLKEKILTIYRQIG